MRALWALRRRATIRRIVLPTGFRRLLMDLRKPSESVLVIVGRRGPRLGRSRVETGVKSQTLGDPPDTLFRIQFWISRE